MAKYAVVQRCPVPASFAPVLRQVVHASKCTLQSVYRGRDARALLNKYGKHDQEWLFEHLPAGQANPPGRSTHERRSDGVAFRGPVGRWLFAWQVGIDVDDAHVQAFIRAAAKLGYTVTVTYPGSRVEYHHVNFRRKPIFRLPALKKGAKGPRVVKLTRYLHILGYLDRRQFHFDSRVKRGVEAFQKKEHQKVDGVAGTQTLRAILVAVRRHKQKAGKK